jgi:carbon storage regulator CsrA
MLVLSRRANETIRFPQLGISVSIVSVKGNRVQVGVDAPPDIQVLRKELESAAATHPHAADSSSSQMVNSQELQFGAAKKQHDFKNRLNHATLGLHLAQRQLDAGQSEAAQKTLSIALARLTELEKAVATRNASEPGPVGSVANSQKGALQKKCSKPTGPTESLEISDIVTTTLSSDGSAGPIEILLVEDDQNEQALMRTLLEMEGYRVHTASNGIEAMKCLERVSPQCVLLDMMMPECDGPETLERLRAIPSFDELPVFAVSGTSPESMGVAIGTDGVEDWFPKPLNAPRLVQHMRRRIFSTCS